jgi:hypothetical protein
VYRNIDDREWTGLWVSVWQLVQEAGIVVINSNNKDDTGGENIVRGG